MPILTGTDGVNKMSKSLGNYIGVDEQPEEIFGKVMSIPDNIMIDYFKLLTRLDKKEIDEIEDNIKNQKLNPSIAKRKLAKLIIEILYSKNDAVKAEEYFDIIFKQKDIPDNVDEHILSKKDLQGKRLWVVKLLVDSGLAKSNGEGRRLVSQGAVKVDGKKVDNPDYEWDLEYINNKIIQKGKRHFRKIIIKN
jgi:tyrosyl-tRNA synthetase